MNELKKQREIIDDIDKEMAKLFEKRLETVSEVAAIKKEKGLLILDRNREAEVIKKNLHYIKQEKHYPYYHQFIEMVMSIMKEYQKDKNSEE
ncbi:MAG: chorismate mutase [Anaerorhabdus sp.]